MFPDPRPAPGTVLWVTRYWDITGISGHCLVHVPGAHPRFLYHSIGDLLSGSFFLNQECWQIILDNLCAVSVPRSRQCWSCWLISQYQVATTPSPNKATSLWWVQQPVLYWIQLSVWAGRGGFVFSGNLYLTSNVQLKNSRRDLQVLCRIICCWSKHFQLLWNTRIHIFRIFRNSPSENFMDH